MTLVLPHASNGQASLQRREWTEKEKADVRSVERPAESSANSDRRHAFTYDPEPNFYDTKTTCAILDSFAFGLSSFDF
jgi:hypothetical protein